MSSSAMSVRVKEALRVWSGDRVVVERRVEIEGEALTAGKSS